MEPVRFLHLLAMAFFLGGQLMLAAVVVPVLRGGDREPLRAAARRFGGGSLIALAVLVVTGALMAGEYDRWGETALQVKLALVVAVVALIAAHARRPERHALEGLVFLASLAIAYLGVTLAH
jgi:putative copper export protein